LFFKMKTTDVQIIMAPSPSSVDHEFNNAPVIRQKTLKEEWDMETALNIWVKLGKIFISGYKLTPINQPIIKNLIQYVMGDDSFISTDTKYSLNKGIALFGPTGVGKTITMQILGEFIKLDEVMYFRYAQVHPFIFRIISVNELVSDFIKRGWDSIEEWSIRNIICIDDLGSESQSTKFYGNEINVVETLIEERYRLHKITHITSNLEQKSVRTLYGDRVASRLNAMVNVFIIEDQDFRS